MPYEAGETTEWKFYDRLGVVVVGEVNEGPVRETGDSRCYQFYVTDTTAYTRHQAEVRRLCKTYPKKRRRYFTSGRTDGNGDLPPVPLNMKLG